MYENHKSWKTKTICKIKKSEDSVVENRGRHKRIMYDATAVVPSCHLLRRILTALLYRIRRKRYIVRRLGIHRAHNKSPLPSGSLAVNFKMFLKAHYRKLDVFYILLLTVNP